MLASPSQTRESKSKHAGIGKATQREGSYPRLMSGLDKISLTPQAPVICLDPASAEQFVCVQCLGGMLSCAFLHLEVRPK